METPDQHVYTYFDIQVASEPIGRVVFQLHTEQAPENCRNFRTLCDAGFFNDLHIYKIIKNFLVQFGDEDLKNSNIPIENAGNFEESALLLCFNNNNNQFFVTLEKSPHLNNKNFSVLGFVKYGKNLFREIEKLNVVSNKNTDSDSWKPVDSILIKNSGLWIVGKSELPNKYACVNQIGGDIYEEYPDDNDLSLNLDFENVEESYKIANTIKSSADILFKSGNLNDSYLKYIKSLRYCNELLPDSESNTELAKKFQILKSKIYLNLTLVTLNLKKFNKCIDYCGYLLQMDDIELTNVQFAKIFYRLGKSYSSLKKFDIALETFEKGLMLSPNDPSIKREFDIVNTQINSQKSKEKAKFAKFLSS